MPKNKTVFVCNNCGNESSKWLGKCPACGEWNSFFEEKVVDSKTTSGLGARTTATKANVLKLNNVETNNYERYKTGYEELDRVLGGGLVQGSLVLIGGEPGIRKIYFNSSNMRQSKGQWAYFICIRRRIWLSNKDACR